MLKSMLIVDDNDTDRYIIKRFTEKSQLFDHVYSLNDGEEAYDHFKNEEESAREVGDGFPPSVVLLDVNMPRMNGFEFLEKFSELPNHKKFNTLFIAMLTSSEDDEDKKKALQYPFVSLFLPKPFKKEYVQILSDKIDEKMATLDE
jgi:CheY-like chemotaxis protein